MRTEKALSPKGEIIIKGGDPRHRTSEATSLGTKWGKLVKNSISCLEDLSCKEDAYGGGPALKGKKPDHPVEIQGKCSWQD